MFINFINICMYLSTRDNKEIFKISMRKIEFPAEPGTPRTLIACNKIAKMLRIQNVAIPKATISGTVYKQLQGPLKCIFSYMRVYKQYCQL